MANSKLAAEMGTEYAKMLFAVLPSIENSLGKGRPKASFTVKAQFQVAKNGDTEVIITQSSSIPMDLTIYKLNYTSGQLALFEGEPSEESPSL